MNNRKTNKNKGITLIALIVTIILMLILASVTINIAINGELFGHAKEATFKTKLAQYKENFERNMLLKDIENDNTVLINDIYDLHETIQKQIESLNAGSQNCQNGISMVETAENSLTEIHSFFQRIDYLLGKYGNSTEDINAVQSEISQLIVEIDSLSNTTMFNDKHLLDGSINSKNPYVIECGNGYFKQGKIEISIEKVSFKSLYGASEIDYSDVPSALAKIRSAFNKLGEIRSYLGSRQNRLEYIISYLDGEVEAITNLDINIFTESGNIPEEQAIKNAKSWQTTYDFIYIIDIGLGKIAECLDRLHFLAVECVNNTYSEEESIDDQEEVDTLLDEIDRILTYTGVENKRFFDGTYPCVKKLSLKILGIDNVSVLTNKEAITSITKIQNAIDKVESIRTELGNRVTELEDKLSEEAKKGYAFDVDEMLSSKYIGEISKDLKDKLKIINGELTFVGEDEKERKWAEEVGIKVL